MSEKPFFLWAAVLLLVLQSVWLVFFCFTNPTVVMDKDYANMVYHFREVVRQGTLNLPDWNGTTSLEIDSAFLFGLPVYALTGSIRLSSGISCLSFALLYALVVYLLLGSADVSVAVRCMTIALLITPYAYGMLEYTNMLFFNGAQYTVKVLTPLMLILLIVWRFGESHTERIRYGITWVLYLFLLFVTTVSSGVYTMICGVLPVWMGVLYLSLREDSWEYVTSARGRRLFLSGMVAFISGFILHGRFFPEGDRNNMMLTRADRMESNLKAVAAGVFKAFGAAPDREITAMSAEGIFMCCKILFVILLLVSFFQSLKKKEMARVLLAVLFFCVTMILILTDTRYSGNTTMEQRYYLIGAVPLIPLAGISLQRVLDASIPSHRYVVQSVAIVLAAIVILGNSFYVWKSKDRSGYLTQMRGFFREQGVESVFFIDNEDDANICRALDDTIRYGNYQSDTRTLSLSYNSYYTECRGDFYGDRNAIAIVEGRMLTDYIPEEIASQYTYVGKTRWLDVYISDRVWFQ